MELEKNKERQIVGKWMRVYRQHFSQHSLQSFLIYILRFLKLFCFILKKKKF